MGNVQRPAPRFLYGFDCFNQSCVSQAMASETSEAGLPAPGIITSSFTAFPRMSLSAPVHKSGNLASVPERRAGKASDRGILAEYVAGSGSRLLTKLKAVLRGNGADAANSIECHLSPQSDMGSMQRRSNAGVCIYETGHGVELVYKNLPPHCSAGRRFDAIRQEAMSWQAE